MYTGLKIQKDFTDEYQDMILSEDHELVKLKKIIDWDEIDKIYKECYPSKVGNSTKETNIVTWIDIAETSVSQKLSKINQNTS
jgi:lysine/ornithine N-monooxygenase